MPRLVEGAGLESGQVVFEITERSQVSPAVISAAVEGLRAEGFAVALDDVGTGNNGLEMLRKVTFDYIKVDRSIMLGALDGDCKGRAGLMAILAFAAHTQAMVIAEGIEDPDMLSFVGEVGWASLRPENGLSGIGHGPVFGAVQGHLLGRPDPAFVSSDGAAHLISVWEAAGEDAA